MSNQRGISLWLGLILVLTVILVASVACWGSPLMDLIIENQTAQVLTVYVDDYEVGDVGPGGQIIWADAPGNMSRYIIEAKNTQGEAVFSETFTFETRDKYHLQQIKDGVYKAVIPPLQSN